MNAGLCQTCRMHRMIKSDRGSVFHLCERAFSDPTFVKYPPLPVVRCAGYEKISELTRPLVR